MNLLYERFPEHVVVNGKKIRIVTDFREYLKLIDLLKDEEVDTMSKANLIMQWFLDDPGEDFSECLQALSDFVTNYRGQEIKKNLQEKDDLGDEKQHNPVISYTQDAPYIISGFQECYGIDLLGIPYMHWWKFQMLIDGMNEECELKKRMNYRNIDLNKIQDKKERERIRKVQKQIAITDHEVTDEEIGDVFGSMMF